MKAIFDFQNFSSFPFNIAHLFLFEFSTYSSKQYQSIEINKGVSVSLIYDDMSMDIDVSRMNIINGF